MANKPNIVLQSTKVARSGGDFSPIQQKIIYSILGQSIIQLNYKGHKAGEKISLSDEQYGNLTGHWFILKIKNFLCRENSKNHLYIKNEIKELDERLSCVKESASKYSIVHFFDQINVDLRRGEVGARMTRSFFENMYDLTQGLTAVDLNLLMGFKSKYAMKMYELIVRGDTRDFPVIPLDELRRLTGVTYWDKKKNAYVERYSVVSKFEKYVLDVAQKELSSPESQSPYTFVYKRAYDSQKKFTGYKITVFFRPGNNDYEQQLREKKERRHLCADLGAETARKLNDCGFDEYSITNNIHLLTAAKEHLDLLYLLPELHARSRMVNAAKPVGYIINALKSELEKKGFDILENGKVVKKVKKGDLAEGDALVYEARKLAEALKGE